MNISLIIHLHTQPMVTSLKKSWQETNVTRITWVDHSLTLIHMDTILKCLVRPTLNLFIVLIDGLLLKARKRQPCSYARYLKAQMVVMPRILKIHCWQRKNEIWNAKDGRKIVLAHQMHYYDYPLRATKKMKQTISTMEVCGRGFKRLCYNHWLLFNTTTTSHSH